MKIFQLSFIATSLSFLLACGGGGSSSPSTPASSPSPAPAPEPVEPAFTISISSQNARQSNLTECQTSPDSDQLFVDVTNKAGINFAHQMEDDGILGMSGGIAAGDFDKDGLVDLYALGGDNQRNLLLKNNGDGTFSDIASSAGVDLLAKSSGPSFGDFNGDGDLDLFVGSVGGSEATLFANNGDGTFTDTTVSAGLTLPGNNFASSWGDYDNDQDLDLVITHQASEENDHYAFLWRNDGDATFTDVSIDAGLPRLNQRDLSFTPTFADINNDGFQDLLMIIDSNETRVYLNNQNGGFDDQTDPTVITDLAGMGSAVVDYDHDGDLDWFVTSISYRDGVTSFGSLTPGNRFYENMGDGVFEDKTDETGTRHGFWGWGACFTDVNNDMHPDIFHVNGMLQLDNPTIDIMFESDPSRLFIANGDKTFTEKAVEMGIEDNGMGRGIVCFDYDRDGDQDLYINNYNQAPKLYCNTGNQNNFINIQLSENTNNSQALGARIYVTANGIEQMRELRSGNNFVSQNPVEAHFGLGDAVTIQSVKIRWPDGEETEIDDLTINKFVSINRTFN